MWTVKTIYRDHEEPALDGQESNERFEDAAEAEAQFCMRAAAVGVPAETATAALIARADRTASASVSAHDGSVTITFQA